MKKIVIEISVPDGVEVQVGSSAPATVPASTPVCPTHGAEKVKPSKYGGFYCTAADDSQERGYCVWKVK